MQSAFKTNIREENFSFYRTILEDKVVYFAMYGKSGERQSIKLGKESGSWKILSMKGIDLNYHTAEELVETVKQNENKVSKVV